MGDPEDALGDDQGNATDLDGLDALARAGGDRVEKGGAADLGALTELDLLPEADPPVAGKVECERAGRRSCRRVLGDPLAG